MPIEFDGPNSKVSADTIAGQGGSTITIQSGHSLSGSGSGLTALPAANLTGTIAAISGANLTNLNATNLASGTIPDARVPASAVTQHVTEYNDASIRADILNLALNQAIADNRVAFNLDNSFVDGFEDDTGITTETNVDRNTSGEYVSSASSASITYSSGISPTYTKIGNYNMDWNASLVHGYLTDNSATTGPGTNSTTLNGGFKIDLGTSYILNSGTIDLGSHRTNGDTRQLTITYSSDDSSYTGWDFSGISSSTQSSTGSASTITSATSAGVINLSGHSSNGNSSILRLTSVPTITTRYIKVILTGCDFHDANNRTSQFDFTTITGGANATGTLISDAQTASSSRTSCSGVIMYENESGTATLGTDLKIYFTANNGTNWTEAASYGTATTYTGGKKIVKLGATTVTGGTQVALKAVWANQVSGSKVTRLHGWAVNY